MPTPTLLVDIVHHFWRISVPDIGRLRLSPSRGVPQPTLVFLTFTTLSLLAAPGTGGTTRPHQCYVCMPNDKNSSTARDIQLHFPGQVMPDCSNFPRVIEDDYADNALEFQFDCPPTYVGCAIRSNGPQISRTCTPKPFQGCMYPNGVELCYCTRSLCNRDNATAQAKSPLHSIPREPLRTSRFFADGGVTDDEDLIPGAIPATRPQHHRQGQQRQPLPRPTTTQESSQDEIQEEGSGGGHYDDDEDELDEYDEVEEGNKSIKEGEMTRLELMRNRTFISQGYDPVQGRRNLTFPVPSDPNNHNESTPYDPAHTHHPSPAGGDKEDLDDAPTVQQGSAHSHAPSRLLSLFSILFLVNLVRQS